MLDIVLLFLATSHQNIGTDPPPTTAEQGTDTEEGKVPQDEIIPIVACD